MIRGAGILALFARNARVLRRMIWSTLFAHIGEPVFYFAVFGYGLGRIIGDVEGMPYLTWVVPGICVTSAAMSATFESTYAAFTKMDRQKTYLAIASTPVSIEEIIVGESLWAATLGTANSCFVLGAGAAFGVVFSPESAAGIIALSFASALVGSALALCYTSRAKGYEAFAVYFTLVMTPLQVLSGAYFPIAVLPCPLRTAAVALPFTLSVQAARAGGIMAPASFLISVAAAAILLTIAVRGIRRRVIV